MRLNYALMSYFDTDPTKPTQELLNDIRAATQQAHFPGLPLLPFANLLVKVGAEASETIEGLKNHITELNEKNAKLQWWVVALAIAAFVSAVVQTVIAVVAFLVTPPNAPAVSMGSSSAAAVTTVPAPSPLPLITPPSNLASPASKVAPK